MKVKNYDTIDLLKFAASILIFAMHMSAFVDFGEWVNVYCLKLIARFGVPFFFTTSSFFLFSKADGKNITASQLGRYIKRISLLYITYFILNGVWILHSGIGLSNLFSPRAWLVFIQNALFSSTFTGSWYLISCMFSSVIIYLLSKKLSSRSIILITFPVYVFCIFTSAYSGLLPEHILNNIFYYFASPQNSIICGLLYFAIGKYIAEKQKDIDHPINTTPYAVLTLLFFALYYAEITLLDHFHILGGTDAAFMLIPLSYTLTMFCVNSAYRIRGASLMRKASTVIYCSQATVMLVGRFVAIRLLSIRHTFLIFLISSVIMTIGVGMVFLLQKKTNIKWAKYLT